VKLNQNYFCKSSNIWNRKPRLVHLNLKIYGQGKAFHFYAS